MPRLTSFAAFALAVSACALSTIPIALGLSEASAAPAPVAVKIANFTFQAPAVTVKAGTTVTWRNDDDIPHTVVAKDGSFKSKVLDTGDQFSFTFAKPGKFVYFCSIHPMMIGKVIVKP
jgi:amicyanin